MEEKVQLRKWAKTTRAKLDIEKISAKLVSKLNDTSEYNQAKNVLLYYPINNEINLLALLKDKSKNFYLPKIDKLDLLCCPYSKGDKTCLSCFNTCEPLTEPCSKNIIDIAIIPALAVDKNNYRLGYGGGFYDRFLRDFQGFTFSCIPKALIVDTIYPEEHDVKISKIITA